MLLDVSRCELQERHCIQPWNILSLSEVCMPPGRYKSPEHFHWSRISTFHAETESVEAGDESLAELLKKWGYGLGIGEVEMDIRLKIFQQRYGCVTPSETRRKLRGLISAREAAQSLRGCALQ